MGLRPHKFKFTNHDETMDPPEARMLEEWTEMPARIAALRAELAAEDARSCTRQAVIARELDVIERSRGTFAAAPPNSPLDWLPPELHAQLASLKQELSAIPLRRSERTQKIEDAEDTRERILFKLVQSSSQTLRLLQLKRTQAEADVAARSAAIEAFAATLAPQATPPPSTAPALTNTDVCRNDAPLLDALAAAQRGLVRTLDETAEIERLTLAKFLGVGIIPGCVVAAGTAEYQAAKLKFRQQPNSGPPPKLHQWESHVTALTALDDATRALQAHDCACSRFSYPNTHLEHCDPKRKHAEASKRVQAARARLDEQQRAHRDALAALASTHAAQLARCAALLTEARAAQQERQARAQLEAESERVRSEQQALVHRVAASALLNQAEVAIGRARDAATSAHADAVGAAAANAPALARARSKLEALERERSLVEAAAARAEESVRAVQEARAHHVLVAREVAALVIEREDARARVHELDALVQELRTAAAADAERTTHAALAAAAAAAATRETLTDALKRAQAQLDARNALLGGASNATAQSDALRALPDAELESLPTSLALLLHAAMQETGARARAVRARADADAARAANAAAEALLENARQEEERRVDAAKLTQMALAAAAAAAEAQQCAADAALCVVCVDAPRAVLVLPCRHNCVCVACAVRLGFGWALDSQESQEPPAKPAAKPAAKPMAKPVLKGAWKKKEVSASASASAPAPAPVCPCPVCRTPIASALRVFG